MRPEQTNRVAVSAIVRECEPLNDDEMQEVFAVSPKTLWYRAVISKLDEYKTIQQETAAAMLSERNEIGMAGCIGAVDIIDTLIRELDMNRKRANR